MSGDQRSVEEDVALDRLKEIIWQRVLHTEDAKEALALIDRLAARAERGERVEAAAAEFLIASEVFDPERYKHYKGRLRAALADTEGEG
jgi:hypothetical protein